MSHLTEILAPLIVLGLAAQWLGWHYKIPIILLLVICGLLAGPLLGLIRPSVNLGEAFQPLVRLAVVVILLEGGMTLRLEELRQAGAGIGRLISLTVSLNWLFGAAAGYWIAGLSWPVAVVLGAIMVGTGPTVILPLLPQARLRRRPASDLKWEGIANDPAGALLSVVAFQYVVSDAQTTLVGSLFDLGLGLLAAMLLGLAAGRLLGRAFGTGRVPEYLKGPLALAVAMAVYVPAQPDPGRGGTGGRHRIGAGVGEHGTAGASKA